jgi:cyanophycin synthetase
VGESDNAPGRFNVFDYKGATVIADYGHNPDAIQALVKAVEAMPAKRRSVVISGAGDRRDEDIRDQTRILGRAFDDVLLYEDQCQRGRSDGEVVALLREGLKGAPRTSHVEEIKGGEFVCAGRSILIDQVDEALRILPSGWRKRRLEGDLCADPDRPGR